MQRGDIVSILLKKSTTDNNVHKLHKQLAGYILVKLCNVF